MSGGPGAVGGRGGEGARSRRYLGCAAGFGAGLASPMRKALPGVSEPALGAMACGLHGFHRGRGARQHLREAPHADVVAQRSRAAHAMRSHVRGSPIRAYMGFLVPDIPVRHVGGGPIAAKPR